MTHLLKQLSFTILLFLPGPMATARIDTDERPEGLHRAGTYTTTRFYKADSPLQNAGLLGPVTLRWE